jgi:ketosteroid isomerase-like protein
VALGIPLVASPVERTLTLAPGVAPHAGVDAVYGRFAQGYRTLDAALVAAQYSDAAAYLAPGKPAEFGRVRIEAHFSGFFSDVKRKGGKLAISFRILQRRVEADLGYDVGIYSLEGASREGSTWRSQGKFVTVARRTKSGAWQFEVDAYSGLPDANAVEPSPHGRKHQPADRDASRSLPAGSASLRSVRQ